ncbi:hypothetical protein KP13_32017 [Klebsiella pneumoniae subsp. pneumoniae Kp13]|nr:hypothetical protein KP13_32017 [Klebsiella pneumoniae subsp. pneumoniae Kp13]
MCFKRKHSAIIQGNSLGCITREYSIYTRRLSRCRHGGLTCSPRSGDPDELPGVPELTPSCDLKSIEPVPVRTATRSPLTV